MIPRTPLRRHHQMTPRVADARDPVGWLLLGIVVVVVLVAVVAVLAYKVQVP